MTQVPISVVYRKDLVKKDGSDPLLLDAYGALPSVLWSSKDYRKSMLLTCKESRRRRAQARSNRTAEP